MHQAIAAAGFTDPEKKYLVALPAGNSKICGVGGGNLAVLFVNQCGDAPWSFVVGHELFHTFGAVNNCAAHASNGHTSGPSNDLMFPYVLNVGVTGVLDQGHDELGTPGDDHLPASCPPQANVANSLWLTSHPFFRPPRPQRRPGTASRAAGNDSFSEDCTPDCVETGRPARSST